MLSGWHQFQGFCWSRQVLAYSSQISVCMKQETIKMWSKLGNLKKACSHRQLGSVNVEKFKNVLVCANQQTLTYIVYLLALKSLTIHRYPFLLLIGGFVKKVAPMMGALWASKMDIFLDNNPTFPYYGWIPTNLAPMMGAFFTILMDSFHAIGRTSIATFRPSTLKDFTVPFLIQHVQAVQLDWHENPSLNSVPTKAKTTLHAF